MPIYLVAKVAKGVTFFACLDLKSAPPRCSFSLILHFSPHLSKCETFDKLASGLSNDNKEHPNVKFTF